MNSQQELVVKQCWPKKQKENEQSKNIVQLHVQHQPFLTTILAVLIKIDLQKVKSPCKNAGV